MAIVSESSSHFICVPINLTMEPLIKASDIANYIPQGAPMVMVSEMLDCDDTSTTSNLHIREDNIFCFNQKFQAPGLLENIAQTAALRMGYLARQQGLSKPPIGMIGAISKVNIMRLPKQDTWISTRIEIRDEVFGIQLIEGISYQEDLPLASCEMKIVISTDS